MIDKAHIGKIYGRVTTEVEKGRLRFFAKAIGENDPVYTDEAFGAEGGPSFAAGPADVFLLPADASMSLIRRRGSARSA